MEIKMLVTRRRRVFSMEEKAQIIKRLKDGESNVSIAREFGMTHSTISTIWKDREKILYHFETKSLKRKRAKESHHKDIEDALVDWIKEQRAVNAPVNTRTLKEKADDIAKSLGKADFKCSSSWIQRFRGRNRLAGTRMPREITRSDSFEEEWLPQDWLSQEWLTQDRLSEEWMSLCEGYKPDDIFNADETGLFYNMTPEKTLRFRHEQFTPTRIPKTRITLMLAANMTGTCKHRLLVIGAKKLSTESLRQLSVDYECNNKAWMTAEIYEKWLREWDRNLSKSERKIVLIVDKSPVHPEVEDLCYIKVVCLPANIPEVLQPMTQGIITSLKAQYRKLQVLHMLQKIEKGKQKALNLFDAIINLSEAWSCLPKDTIADSFNHAGFKDLTIIATNFEEQKRATVSARSPFVGDNSAENPDNVTLIRLIQALGPTLTLTELEEFIEIDNNTATCATLAQEAPKRKIKRKQEELNSDGNICEQEKVTVPSLNDALAAVVTLQKFLMFKPEFNNSNYEEMLGFLRKNILKDYTNHQCNKIRRPRRKS